MFASSYEVHQLKEHPFPERDTDLPICVNTLSASAEELLVRFDTVFDTDEVRVRRRTSFVCLVELCIDTAAAPLPLGECPCGVDHVAGQTLGDVDRRLAGGVGECGYDDVELGEILVVDALHR